VRDPKASETQASRRDVLRGVVGGLAALSLAPLAASVARAQTTLAVVEIAPGLKTLAVSGVNVVALATSAGQVVVDSGPAADQELLIGVLRNSGGPMAKIIALVNTHWHRDQTGGNERLGTEGTTIIAHDKTRQRLRAGWYVPASDSYEPPLAAAALPTKTFLTTDEATFGDKRVEFGYLLEAHTDGDAYVRFPAANVIAAGDAISPQRDPVLDWFGGGWLGGRVDSLKQLLDMTNARTRFVPSFGDPVGRDAVQAEHDTCKLLFDRFFERVRKGETPEYMLANGVMDGTGRVWNDAAKFVHDANKGFWGHNNTLSHDIV
jgi:glyoxylase-like metal-dependent hydrolase (beta-lactamase superfamily II)